MQNVTIVFLAVCSLVALFSCGTAASTSFAANCGPDDVGIPPKYRNLCLIYNDLIKQQAYDKERSEMRRFGQGAAASYPDGVPADIVLLPNGDVKRQDVEHVFLRFGRRR